MICQHCGAAEEDHDYEQMARVCYPRQLATYTRALDESVRLQSHYATLLNQYDGGARIVFRDGTDFLGRLALSPTERAVDAQRRAGQITAARFYRGKKLHLAIGPPTGPDNQPIIQERVTLCARRLMGRWIERVDPRFRRRPTCPKCAAEATRMEPQPVNDAMATASALLARLDQP